MVRLNYKSAETLIYDPGAANRTATRSALYSLGFRKIETAATLETFNEAIPPPPARSCAVRNAGQRRRALQHDPVDAPGRAGLQSLRRHHRDGVGEDRLARHARRQFRRRRSPAAPVLDLAARPRASRPMSSAARASSSPPTMSVPTAAKNNSRALQHRAVRAAQLAQDEGEGTARSTEEIAAAPRDRDAHRARSAELREIAPRRLPGLHPVAPAPGARRAANKRDIWPSSRRLPHAVAKRCRDSEFDGANQWCQSIVAAA